ncbi:MAG: ATP-binding protein [Myxococcota bacterium]|nr:ATP-binding protein [Myxococcota bacterium]
MLLDKDQPDAAVAALEARIEQTDHSVRTILERLSDGMLIHADGRVVFANRAVRSVLGWPLDGELGTERLRDVLALFAAGVTAASEWHFSRNDGTAVIAEMTSFPILFEGEAGSLFIVRDMSERRRIEAQLLLADRMASMGTLAAGVAHEVNNPLGYAVANVGFALEELAALDGELVPGEAEGASALAARLARARGTVHRTIEALREARQGGDRVRHIVRDLKTFSRGDDDRRGPLDVRRVLESSINMAYNEIRHRARLVKDYGTTPFVQANEARLGQVFLNLLLNAAHAIREGDVERQSIRVVTSTDEQGRCLVEVSDTGHGIVAEHLKHVFEPFFTTKQGSGTGLGLSICQNIVTAMGGRISVESAAGRGSTFRVTLPQADEGATEVPALAFANSPQPLERGRVLVIDDEPMMARAVQRLLEGEHDVTATSDPLGAVEQVRSGERFDAIVCDLMMPTMGGIDVYDAIASVEPEQARRIVFMTGGAFTPRTVRFLESVENVHIEKPLDRAALRAAIRAQMS